MNWLHPFLCLASGVELCSSTGTYLISLIECTLCFSQFALAHWKSTD